MYLEVNIDIVKGFMDFEAIKDDTNPYPTLLVIDSVFNNQATINLKN